jgi:hypothetical protein
MTLVHSTYMEFVKQRARAHDLEWIASHLDKPPKLFISALGFCHRKAFFDATRALPDHPWHAEITHPHNDYLLLKFRDGNVGEEATAQALSWMHGTDLTCQFQVEDPIWSGRPDFLIDPDTIVEHKVTAHGNFVRKDGLPYIFQCFQVLAYRKLLIPQLGRDLHARLYYRGYPGDWAEFEVFDCGDLIVYEGHVNGKARSGQFDASLSEEMEGFEHYWLADELPPRCDHPLSMQFGCARETKAGIFPDCLYFSRCWPELLPKEGPIDEDLLK